MTITLSPDQEQAVRDAIRAGKVTSVDELIERALAALPKGDETPAVTSPSSVFEQGLGLFGSPEDAALLDEVVSIAYSCRCCAAPMLIRERGERPWASWHGAGGASSTSPCQAECLNERWSGQAARAGVGPD